MTTLVDRARALVAAATSMLVDANSIWRPDVKSPVDVALIAACPALILELADEVERLERATRYVHLLESEQTVLVEQRDAAIARVKSLELSFPEIVALIDVLNQRMPCPRCGRPDLQLRDLPVHARTCLSATDREQDAMSLAYQAEGERDDAIARAEAAEAEIRLRERIFVDHRKLWTDRVKQTERERDEARAEVERLQRGQSWEPANEVLARSRRCEQAERERDEAKAEVGRLRAALAASAKEKP